MLSNVVSLRHLRYFDALARSAHFGRAAAACGISQPAMSMQVKELEAILGTALIERGGRHVRLTPFGEEVAARVRGVLRAIDEMGELARSSRGQIAGRLRVGMIPTVAPYLLSEVIKALAREHPHVEVRVREAVTSTLIDDLAEGRIDAANDALPVSEPSLTEVALLTESFLLVRPAADEGVPVPSPRMLADMRLLLLEEGHCFRNQALSFCGLQSASRREALEASSLSTLVQMVKAGIGVTLIPEMAVASEAGSGRVSFARFEDPQPSRTIGMVWRTTSPLGTQLLQVSNALRRRAAP
jgi:LysR family hydrogen peroxide-inducible transcriptional activator